MRFYYFLVLSLCFLGQTFAFQSPEDGTYKISEDYRITFASDHQVVNLIKNGKSRLELLRKAGYSCYEIDNQNFRCEVQLDNKAQDPQSEEKIKNSKPQYTITFHPTTNNWEKDFYDDTWNIQKLVTKIDDAVETKYMNLTFKQSHIAWGDHLYMKGEYPLQMFLFKNNALEGYVWFVGANSVLVPHADGYFNYNVAWFLEKTE